MLKTDETFVRFALLIFTSYCFQLKSLLKSFYQKKIYTYSVFLLLFDDNWDEDKAKLLVPTLLELFGNRWKIHTTSIWIRKRLKSETGCQEVRYQTHQLPFCTTALKFSLKFWSNWKVCVQLLVMSEVNTFSRVLNLLEFKNDGFKTRTIRDIHGDIAPYKLPESMSLQILYNIWKYLKVSHTSSLFISYNNCHVENFLLHATKYLFTSYFFLLILSIFSDNYFMFNIVAMVTSIISPRLSDKSQKWEIDLILFSRDWKRNYNRNANFFNRRRKITNSYVISAFKTLNGNLIRW